MRYAECPRFEPPTRAEMEAERREELRDYHERAQEHLSAAYRAIEELPTGEAANTLVLIDEAQRLLGDFDDQEDVA